VLHDKSYCRCRLLPKRWLLPEHSIIVDRVIPSFNTRPVSATVIDGSGRWQAASNNDATLPYSIAGSLNV
jgi:hypothetical protein